MKNSWNQLDPNDICANCGHKREYHSQFENSIGDNGHSCENIIYIKKAKFQCTCDKFEDDK